MSVVEWDIYAARQQALQGGITANTGSNAGPRTVGPVSYDQRQRLRPPAIYGYRLALPVDIEQHQGQRAGRYLAPPDLEHGQELEAITVYHCQPAEPVDVQQLQAVDLVDIIQTYIARAGNMDQRQELTP